MLSIGANDNLGCADCKASFTSASLLLKHFADHIAEERSRNELSSDNDSRTTTQIENIPSHVQKEEEKEQRKSILETVLRQTSGYNFGNEKSETTCQESASNVYSTLSSEDSPSSNHSQNSGYDIYDAKSMEDVKSSSQRNMVLEIGQRAKEKLNGISLIKFDLQKRLENCVLKLASKHDCSSVNTLKQSSVKMCASKRNCKSNPVNNTCTSSGVCNGNAETDDFNPLKFCVVTLEEQNPQNGKEEMRLEKNESKYPNIFKTSKGASNRKQQMPKKIHRPEVNDVTISKDFASVLDDKAIQKPLTKKKYLCHVCSKGFGWSTDLKRHILTHTGERPFKCQMCDATFTRNFLLQKHESRVHSLGNIDTGCSQEDDTKVKSKTDNVDVKCIELDQNRHFSGKNAQQKRNCHQDQKDNENKMKFEIDIIQERCDKFISKKRKHTYDKESYDVFPQKVFNIL